MKLNIIPLSDSRLEEKISWRVFKVLYFIIGLLGGGLYSSLNSWYYTNCPSMDRTIPWIERRELCVRMFGWSELLWIIIILLIVLRLLFPIIEKMILYIIYSKTVN